MNLYDGGSIMHNTEREVNQTVNLEIEKENYFLKSRLE